MPRRRNLVSSYCVCETGGVKTGLFGIDCVRAGLCGIGCSRFGFCGQDVERGRYFCGLSEMDKEIKNFLDGLWILK